MKRILILLLISFMSAAEAMPLEEGTILKQFDNSTNYYLVNNTITLSDLIVTADNITFVGLGDTTTYVINSSGDVLETLCTTSNCIINHTDSIKILYFSTAVETIVNPVTGGGSSNGIKENNTQSIIIPNATSNQYYDKFVSHLLYPIFFSKTAPQWLSYDSSGLIVKSRFDLANIPVGWAGLFALFALFMWMLPRALMLKKKHLANGLLSIAIFVIATALTLIIFVSV